MNQLLLMVRFVDQQHYINCTHYMALLPTQLYCLVNHTRTIRPGQVQFDQIPQICPSHSLNVTCYNLKCSRIEGTNISQNQDTCMFWMLIWQLHHYHT